MGAIVIVVLLVCGLLAGRMYIKKQRRNLLAERERKLKIAEGIFEDTPPPKVAKRKKRRWGWSGSDLKLELPGFLEHELVNKAPILIERLLQARHACLAARDALKDAERVHARAKAEVDRLALPAQANRADLASWLIAARATCLSERQSGRKFRAREAEFAEACEVYKKAKRSLGKRLSSLDVYELDDLPPQTAQVLQIARVAVQECAPEIPDPHMTETPNYLGEPDRPDPEAEAQFDKISEAVDRMMAAVEKLHLTRSAAEQEFLLLEGLTKGPVPVEPQKPVEQDVQALIESTLTWAARWQEQEEIAHGKVPDVKSALTELEGEVAAVKALLSQLNALRIRNPEDETAQDQADLPSESPSLPSPPAATPAADNAAQEMPKWLRKWDLDEDDAPSGNRRGPAKSAAKANVEKKSLFTDEQESFKEAVSRSIDKVKALAGSAPTAAARWALTPLPPVTANGPKDQPAVDAVRAAMRKLGFAVAQRNAAQAKLAALRATPAQQVVVTEATLDEPNVESFVRNHRRQCDDRAANDAANREQWQRVTDQQKQWEQRQRQLQEAVLALAAACGPALRADHKTWSRDLDATVRSARQLINRYTSTPTPVHTPTVSRSSSSSRRKKAGRRG